MIDAYESLIAARIGPELTVLDHDIAIDIAQLPLSIRGFGHVKVAAEDDASKRLAFLLEALVRRGADFGGPRNKHSAGPSSKRVIAKKLRPGRMCRVDLKTDRGLQWLGVLAVFGAADAQAASPAPDSIEGHLAAGKNAAGGVTTRRISMAWSPHSGVAPQNAPPRLDAPAPTIDPDQASAYLKPKLRRSTICTGWARRPVRPGR